MFEGPSLGSCFNFSQVQILSSNIFNEPKVHSVALCFHYRGLTLFLHLRARKEGRNRGKVASLDHFYALDAVHIKNMRPSNIDAGKIPVFSLLNEFLYEGNCGKHS